MRHFMTRSDLDGKSGLKILHRLQKNAQNLHETQSDSRFVHLLCKSRKLIALRIQLPWHAL